MGAVAGTELSQRPGEGLKGVRARKQCADDSPSDSQRRLGVEAEERPVAQLPGFSITVKRGRVRRGMSPQAGPCKASWPDWFPLRSQEAVLGRVNRCITSEIAQRWAGPGTRTPGRQSCSGQVAEEL